jgi:hypothetical protein
MSQPWRKLRAYFVSLKFPQLSYCLETPASEASGLSGAVTKVFREAGRRRSLGVLSLAALSSGLMAPAAKAQMVITFPGGFTSATGHITLENPLVGGMIHLIPSQCGWTC